MILKKYDLNDYPVKENDAQEVRALKKAEDALKNDPFFSRYKRNKGLAEILRWLLKNKRRCEQQAYFTVDPRDPTMPEKNHHRKNQKG
jgi:DNA topoisomerase-6 subunit A